MGIGVEMTAKAAFLTTAALATKTMERTFVCRDGMQLAAQCYPPLVSTKPTRHKILLLHGWLDNCRTFWKLAPSLDEQDDVIALDLPGHGKSQHKGKDTPPLLLSESAYYVADVLEQLEWTSGGDVTLIGHSMGAAVSLMYAATFPEQVERLVLLEGAGPLARGAKDATQHLRAHVEKRLKGNQALYHGTKGPRVYPSLEKAAETRQGSAKLFPGKQYLSIEAAHELVARAMSSTDDDAGFSFQHDVRLQWPSLLYMTPEQVDALQEAVQCPTQLLLAHDGWPFDDDRLESTKHRLQPASFHILPGSHHFHADPDTADAVAHHVNDFLTVGDTKVN
jgi:pimeloyl-ACP methyl ester carboxylesterase